MKPAWKPQPNKQWLLKFDDVRIVVEPLSGGEDKWVLTFSFGPGRTHIDVYACDQWYDTKLEAFEAAERLAVKLGAK